MVKGANISARLVAFGAAAIQLVGELPRDPAGRHVALQWVRSATGAGANYEEGRAAESRADFVHKLGIAAKEMREACYWIGLIEQSGWIHRDLASLVGEANQLAAILGASARTARNGQAGDS